MSWTTRSLREEKAEQKTGSHQVQGIRAAGRPELRLHHLQHVGYLIL